MDHVAQHPSRGRGNPPRRKNISITDDIDLSGGTRGYYRSSGGCCSSRNGGESGGNGSLWLSSTGVTVTGTISADATRIDAQSIQGNQSTTCVFEDFSPYYTNGFAITLEANFSNGELEARNNGTDTLSVTVTLRE